MTDKRTYLFLCLVGLAVLLLAGCGGGGPADLAAPTISRVVVGRDPTGAPRIEAVVTDEGSGVSEVTAVVTDSALMGPGPVRVPMSAGGAGSYAANLVATSTRAYVEARDRSGNTTRSDEVKVPPPDPGL